MPFRCPICGNLIDNNFINYTCEVCGSDKNYHKNYKKNRRYREEEIELTDQ
ncbi:MAG: hypothetical protein ACFE8A_13385 [Candidatus Hodarchaeota archaeon]